MKIAKDCVVNMHYTLKNSEGTVLDSSEGKEPLAFLHGHGNIIPGLEKALEGQSEGDSLDVVVSPEEGYGTHHEALVQQAPRSAFEGIDNLEIGMRLEASTDQGPVPVRITAIEEDTVTVDGNHELADVELHFNVNIENVRAASEEELEHGHAQ